MLDLRTVRGRENHQIPVLSMMRSIVIFSGWRCGAELEREEVGRS